MSLLLLLPKYFLYHLPNRSMGIQYTRFGYSRPVLSARGSDDVTKSNEDLSQRVCRVLGTVPRPASHTGRFTFGS